LTDHENPWLAPSEVKASGFLELAPDAELPEAADLAVPVSLTDIEHEPIKGTREVPLSSAAALHVGSWVELQVKDNWVRTQLSWASPHGTLFLFTSAFGTTQSMTRRSRDKLIATGAMRLVSGRPMVDGALDAVAQTALLNSLDIKP
jgi:hypothetical protein